eukprot:TRINITY_DN33052_c0_g1_i1.p2 TRINITY_DN33052_c0_g1~~TRINITY_DN33052_c0_g1_i1.p2  ORF type:complete len:113 (-),score=6.66 TRINITY_DN33052_c0_g1_i1:164-502(-)
MCLHPRQQHLALVSDIVASTSTVMATIIPALVGVVLPHHGTLQTITHHHKAIHWEGLGAVVKTRTVYSSSSGATNVILVLQHISSHHLHPITTIFMAVTNNPNSSSHTPFKT